MKIKLIVASFVRRTTTPHFLSNHCWQIIQVSLLMCCMKAEVKFIITWVWQRASLNNCSIFLDCIGCGHTAVPQMTDQHLVICIFENILMRPSDVDNKSLRLVACLVWRTTRSEWKTGTFSTPEEYELLSFDLCFLLLSRWIKVARELKKTCTSVDFQQQQLSWCFSIYSHAVS